MGLFEESTKIHDGNALPPGLLNPFVMNVRLRALCGYFVFLS